MRWRTLPMDSARITNRLLAAATAAIGLCACSGSSTGHGNSAIARVGQAAPDWTAPTTSGTKLSLHEMAGKAVYLNFFATWCPPCNEEAPAINNLQKQYASRGLRIVGIDELENAGKAREFVRKYGLVYPAVVDDGTIGSQYEVNGLPVHVFIDRNGIVKKIVVGEMAGPEIASAVRSML